MEMNDIIELAFVCGGLFGMTIMYIRTRIKLKEAWEEIRGYRDQVHDMGIDISHLKHTANVLERQKNEAIESHIMTVVTRPVNVKTFTESCKIDGDIDMDSELYLDEIKPRLIDQLLYNLRHHVEVEESLDVYSMERKIKATIKVEVKE